MSRSNLQVSNPKVVVSSTGITLPDGLSIIEWAQVGLDLTRARSLVNWAIGDWWRFGEHRYGKRRAVVAGDEWSGPSYQAIADYGWVCAKFSETSRRREDLSFNHHREVANLDPKEADQLLDWCANSIPERGRPRSIRELREEVRQRGMKTASQALEEKLNFPRPTAADLPRFVVAATRAVLGRPAADLLLKGGLELGRKPPELPGLNHWQELLRILARHHAEVAIIPLEERLRLIDRFIEALQVDDAEIVLLNTTRFVQ
jgi:hypothetical protein